MRLFEFIHSIAYIDGTSQLIFAYMILSELILPYLNLFDHILTLSKLIGIFQNIFVNVPNLLIFVELNLTELIKPCLNLLLLKIR